MWKGVEFCFTYLNNMNVKESRSLEAKKKVIMMIGSTYEINKTITISHKNQAPIMPATRNLRNDNEKTTVRSCNGSKNAEGKNAETFASKILVKATKTNSAATQSEKNTRMRF